MASHVSAYQKVLPSETQNTSIESFSEVDIAL